MDKFSNWIYAVIKDQPFCCDTCPCTGLPDLSAPSPTPSTTPSPVASAASAVKSSGSSLFSYGDVAGCVQGHVQLTPAPPIGTTDATADAQDSAGSGGAAVVVRMAVSLEMSEERFSPLFQARYKEVLFCSLQQLLRVP